MPLEIPHKNRTRKHLKYLNGNIIQKSNKTQIRNNLQTKSDKFSTSKKKFFHRKYWKNL